MTLQKIIPELLPRNNTSVLTIITKELTLKGYTCIVFSSPENYHALIIQHLDNLKEIDHIFKFFFPSCKDKDGALQT